MVHGLRRCVTVVGLVAGGCTPWAPETELVVEAPRADAGVASPASSTAEAQPEVAPREVAAVELVPYDLDDCHAVHHSACGRETSTQSSVHTCASGKVWIRSFTGSNKALVTEDTEAFVEDTLRRIERDEGGTVAGKERVPIGFLGAERVGVRAVLHTPARDVGMLAAAVVVDGAGYAMACTAPAGTEEHRCLELITSAFDVEEAGIARR